MMDLYSWATPNGHKVHIMLEECGADYRIHPVDINDPEALSGGISHRTLNRKIPVLVDSDAGAGKEITIFESGAILIYLADKYRRFLSADPAERYGALQWLMFQMSAVGPMMGQLSHFKRRGDANDEYAISRFGAEVRRIHTVMEQHLDVRPYFAGEHYSIADMAVFPWLRVSEKLGMAWSDYPRLRGWYERLNERAAVQRALHRPEFTPAAVA